MNAKQIRTMSNEIKQGDKVRVSKDIPMFYRRYNSYRVFEVEHQVVDIEDGIALLDSIPSKYVTTIPCKYLVKVDAEAKEPKFKVGDKVVRKNVSTIRTIISIDYVDDDEAPTYYYNTVDSQGNNPMDFLESELILYIESTPKYKKGDRVKICSKNAERFGCVGTILEVHDNGTVDVDFNDYYVGGHLYSIDFIEPYTEPTEQTEAEKPNHTIKIPVEVDLTDSYWDAYAADLAKEIVLKTVNSASDRRPSAIAEYATDIAKAVVEGLKRK